MSTLPGWLQAFVKVNAVTHIGDALRGLLGGLVIAMIFAPLALLKFKRR